MGVRGVLLPNGVEVSSRVAPKYCIGRFGQVPGSDAKPAERLRWLKQHQRNKQTEINK